MAATTKLTKKTAAPKRTFKPGICHHRDATGTPNCAKKIVGTSANLCPEHEKAWNIEAKKRTAAKKPATTEAPKLAVEPTAARKPAPRHEGAIARVPQSQAAFLAVEPTVTKVE